MLDGWKNEHVLVRQESGEFAASELVGRWGVSPSSARRCARQMELEGLIECVGMRRLRSGGKGLCYRVLK